MIKLRQLEDADVEESPFLEHGNMPKLIQASRDNIRSGKEVKSPWR